MLVVADRSWDGFLIRPLSFVLVCFAERMNRRYRVLIGYLHEKVRVLRRQLSKRPRFTEDRRRPLNLLPQLRGGKTKLRGIAAQAAKA
jgi:hypothetical protein